MASPRSHELTISITLIIFSLDLTTTTGDNTAFSVEAESMKAYNLTSENRLFCILILSLRASNPNPGDSYGSMEIKVKKGKHHTLLDDVVPSFSLQSTPNSGDTQLINVEAVGLYRRLERKIAEELRDDRQTGFMRVNVYESGSVGSDVLHVTCKDVEASFEPLERGFKKVDCGVGVSTPTAGTDMYVPTPNYGRGV